MHTLYIRFRKRSQRTVKGLELHAQDLTSNPGKGRKNFQTVP